MRFFSDKEKINFKRIIKLEVILRQLILNL